MKAHRMTPVGSSDRQPPLPILNVCQTLTFQAVQTLEREEQGEEEGGKREEEEEEEEDHAPLGDSSSRMTLELYKQ